jgi:putative heme iron utilization protein
MNRDQSGPYVSLVNFATDVSGWPLIFVSRLAWHTQNIAGDRRASLMVAELPPEGDVLTGARVTVMGSLEPVDAAEVRNRYLARHPASGSYINFPDFSFWRLNPQLVHAVAGFGRIETMAADEVFLSAAGWDSLARDAVTHMNEDHAEAIGLYAEKLLSMPKCQWTIGAIDPDGCDLVCENQTARLAFETPVLAPNDLRKTLADLGRKARLM